MKSIDDLGNYGFALGEIWDIESALSDMEASHGADTTENV
jgi:hypothetical protein